MLKNSEVICVCEMATATTGSRDGKAESGSVELLALGSNGKYKHDEDIAHHAQVVPTVLIVQTEHTVYRQLHEYEDIEQGDAGLEYHLALQHHIYQQRQCEGMDYIIEHAPHASIM